jgi:hypothetical protein
MPTDMNRIRVIAAVLLSICATTASGEWRFVGENHGKDARYFIDTSRISSYESMIWVWVLMDFYELQTEDWGSYRSMELLEEVNCGTLEESWYDYIHYAEQGARGKIVQADAFPGYGPMQSIPGSIGEKVILAACDEFVRTYKPKAIKPASLGLPLIQTSSGQ